MRNFVKLIVLELVVLTQNPLLDLLLACAYEVVFVEQHVVAHESEGPDVDFRAVGFLFEDFGRHENWSADYFLIDLFLDCEAEVSELVEGVVLFLLDENVIWFDVSMDDLFPGYEFDSPGQLVHYWESLFFSQASIVAFVDYVVEISVWAEFKDHSHVIVCQKAVVDPGGEEVVNGVRICEFFEDHDFAL